MRQRRQGGSYVIKEVEEDSVSSVSSEEHKLLDVEFQSTGSNASRGHYGSLKDDTKLQNDEDIDPFSFYPPLTRWDYFKVGATPSSFECCASYYYSESSLCWICALASGCGGLLSLTACESPCIRVI